MTDINEYKDLIDFLLGPVRERPALFLGDYKISSLQTFITGYNIGRQLNCSSESKPDRFNEPDFIEWYFKIKNIDTVSLWHTSFLEETNGDEKKALDLFFTYLDEYCKIIYDKNK